MTSRPPRRLRVGSGNSAQPAAVGANITEPRFRARYPEHSAPPRLRAGALALSRPGDSSPELFSTDFRFPRRETTIRRLQPIPPGGDVVSEINPGEAHKLFTGLRSGQVIQGAFGPSRLEVLDQRVLWTGSHGKLLLHESPASVGREDSFAPRTLAEATRHLPGAFVGGVDATSNPNSRSPLASSSARQILKFESVTDPVCRASANHQSSLPITALPFEGVVKSSLVNSPKIHDPCNFVALLKKNRGKRVDFSHRKRFRIVG